MSMDFRILPATGAVRLENVTVPGCLIGQRGLVRMAISIADGTIAEAGGTPVDMGGAMVIPCFVDMHTHLDKGHIWPRSPNPDGTFMGALDTVRADKPGRWTARDLVPRMGFSLRSAYAHGTRAIRTHLDYFGDTDDARVSWEVFAALRDDKMLWPDPERNRALCGEPGNGKARAVCQRHLAISCRTRQEIHARRSNEPGDKHVHRILVEGLGGAFLLDLSRPHHHDLVRKCHGLGLVMGHVDHG